MDEIDTISAEVQGWTKVREEGSRGLSAGPASLPCLSSNNSDKGEKLALVSAYDKRVKEAVYLNTQHFIEKLVGVNNCGFLTLTFRENLKDPKEAQRRLNNLLRRARVEGGGWITHYVCVPELQARGAVHFHLLIGCGGDIRTGVDVDAIAAGDYRTASPLLRGLWSDLRSRCKRYGFGRSELLPIKSNVEGMARYIGKYIGKDACFRPLGKGIRRFRYSQGWKVANSNFQWLTAGAWAWRHKLAVWMGEHGYQSFEEIKAACGPRWAYNHRKQIMGKDLPAGMEFPSLKHAEACGYKSDAAEIRRNLPKGEKDRADNSWTGDFISDRAHEVKRRHGAYRMHCAASAADAVPESTLQGIAHMKRTGEGLPVPQWPCRVKVPVILPAALDGPEVQAVLAAFNGTIVRVDASGVGDAQGPSKSGSRTLSLAAAVVAAPSV
jgi:hypothetical protein